MPSQSAAPIATPLKVLATSSRVLPVGTDERRPDLTDRVGRRGAVGDHGGGRAARADHRIPVGQGDRGGRITRLLVDDDQRRTFGERCGRGLGVVPGVRTVRAAGGELGQGVGAVAGHLGGHRRPVGVAGRGLGPARCRSAADQGAGERLALEGALLEGRALGVAQDGPVQVGRPDLGAGRDACHVDRALAAVAQAHARGDVAALQLELCVRRWSEPCRDGLGGLPVAHPVGPRRCLAGCDGRRRRAQSVGERQCRAQRQHTQSGGPSTAPWRGVLF